MNSINEKMDPKYFVITRKLSRSFDLIFCKEIIMSL